MVFLLLRTLPPTLPLRVSLRTLLSLAATARLFSRAHLGSLAVAAVAFCRYSMLCNPTPRVASSPRAAGRRRTNYLII